MQVGHVHPLFLNLPVKHSIPWDARSAPLLADQLASHACGAKRCSVPSTTISQGMLDPTDDLKRTFLHVLAEK